MIVVDAADRETVIRWIESHVRSLTTFDPHAPLTESTLRR